MLTVACWKWKRIPTGHQLPNVVDYTPAHVHTLQAMVARNTTLPHRFVCITDDPAGLECETIPLWDVYEAGGCYHRLRAFDPDFGLLGRRFAWIDLDAVIVGNIDHILDVDADFAINKYVYKGRLHQHYNGGIVVMTAGARPQVWDRFDPRVSPRYIRMLNHKSLLLGSDQAWISHVLGNGERTFDHREGVYEMMSLTRMRRRVVNEPQNIPADARIILFSGPRDPSMSTLPWVIEHYR